MTREQIKELLQTIDLPRLINVLNGLQDAQISVDEAVNDINYLLTEHGNCPIEEDEPSKKVFTEILSGMIHLTDLIACLHDTYSEKEANAEAAKNHFAKAIKNIKQC